MNELSEILKHSQELLQKEKYLELENYLSNDLLQKYREYELYHYKLEVLFLLNKYDEAKKTGDKMCVWFNLESKTNHLLGVLFQKLGDFEKSEEKYLEALQLNPENPDIYYNLANLYQATKTYSKSLEYYERSLKFSGNKREDVLLNIGAIQMIIQNFSSAILTYQSILEINPASVFAMVGVGNVMLYQREYDEALRYYLLARSLSPEDAVVKLSIANAYKVQNKVSKARELYDELLSIHPNNSDALLGLAGLAYDEYKAIEAHALYSRYLVLNKISKDPEYILAEKRSGFTKRIKKFTNAIEVWKLVDEIKKILVYKGDSIVHYSSLGALKSLVGENSSFRISHSAFLNDPSEGLELLNLLELKNIVSENNVEKDYLNMPYIGSFNNGELNDNLGMWRLYGKEKNIEATGCSIKLNSSSFLRQIQNITLKIPKAPIDYVDKAQQLKLFNVAYLRDDNSKITNNNPLNGLLGQLKIAIDAHLEAGGDSGVIIHLLNRIRFLFKSVQYEYEKEVRICTDFVGFDVKYDDCQFPPKLYVDLCPILSSLDEIILGPKVENSTKWGAYLNWALLQQGKYLDIKSSSCKYD